MRARGRAELLTLVQAKGGEVLGLSNALVRLKKDAEERCAARPHVPNPAPIPYHVLKRPLSGKCARTGTRPRTTGDRVCRRTRTVVLLRLLRQRRRVCLRAHGPPLRSGEMAGA